MIARRHLGNLLAAERRRRAISISEAARLAGYRHLRKGVRRIEVFEKTGCEVRPFVVRLFTALNINLEAAEQRVRDAQRKRHEAKLNRWIAAHPNASPPRSLIVRAFAACYVQHRLPPHIRSAGASVAYARTFARRWSHEVCLILDGEVAIYLDELGAVIGIRFAT